MPRPKSFKSSFSCVYLVPEALYHSLMKTLNNVQYQDVDILNQNAMEGKLASISEGEGNVQSLPPVVKVNEPIFEPNEETSERIFDEPNMDATNSDFIPNSEPNTIEEPIGTKDMSTGTDEESVGTKDMSTGTDEIQNTEKDTQTFDINKEEKETQTSVPSNFPQVQKQDMSTQMELPIKKSIETQTDGMFSLKKCETCKGLFQGMDNLVKHQKLYHNSAGTRSRNPAKRKTPDYERTDGKKKNLKVTFVPDKKENTTVDLTINNKKRRKKQDLQSGGGIIQKRDENNNKLGFTHWL